ncbi:DegT/DnrJ/EryC1/StrS family aminotransferase [Amylibacter sp.]|nr:DegT/DnrJ/EryC1/StrS family aminotransferase [Amylibacter sp.]
MIRLSKSFLGDEEKAAVTQVIEDGYLGMGSYVGDFEKLLEDYFQRSVVCVSTGTAALQLSLQAIDIEPGDEVLVPALTYVASFQAISGAGATPIACDVNDKTLFIDVEDARNKITKRTKAIMPVYYGGGYGDVDGIAELARVSNIRVIDDSAHAFGSKRNGLLIGSFGDISCFSFDGIKNITSGEGGCVVSDDPEVIKKVKDARLLGVENDTDSRLAGKRTWDFNVTNQGWRCHMSNLMAGIGIVQFHKKDFMFERRMLLAKYYDSCLRDYGAIEVLPNNYDEIVPHIYVIRVKGIKDRDKLVSELLEKGIQSGKHYLPNHLLDFYKGKSTKPIKNTESIWPELITLPLHPELTTNQVDYICENLKQSLKIRAICE